VSRTVAAVRRSAKSRRIKAPAIIRLPHGEWKPRPHQEKLWDYLEGGGLRAVAVMHRRAGKDEVGLHWTAVAAHKRPGTYWTLLPQAEQARKALWTAVDEETGIRRIDQAFPEAIRAQTNEQSMFIRFTCGSTWQLLGADNYNTLVGSPPVGCVFSEWPLADPSSWPFISPILERNGGWAYFPYTPRGKNHGYSFWQMSQREPGWFGVMKRASETGIFTPQQLATIKRQLMELYGEEDGEALFQQEYECDFHVAIIGSYYGRLIARLEADGRVARVPHDPNYPVHTAWDLGLDDATAIWFAQVVGREIRIIDFLQVRNRALVDIAKDVLTKPYTYAEHYWPHDGDTRELTYAKTRRETAEGLRLRPICIGEKRDPTERINAVRQLLPKCVFDNGPAVTKGLEALRSYHVQLDEKNKTPRQKPAHDWSSHPADAFGELAMQMPDSGYMHRRRQRQAIGDYDPTRLGDPQYTRRLEAEALAEEAEWEEPRWRRYETSGIDDFNPFNVR
jgi:hypothetical protein